VESAEDVDFTVKCLCSSSGGRGRPRRGADPERSRDRAGGDRARRRAGRLDGLSAGLIRRRARAFKRAGHCGQRSRVAEDYARKAHGEVDAKLVRAAAQGTRPLVEWLSGTYAMPFEVITDFNYPGHSAHRMHGLPSRPAPS